MSRSSASAGWIGLGGSVAALLMTGIGLGLGSLITLLIVLAMRPDAPSQETVRAAPVVRVVAPSSTSITLNGDAVGTEFTVSSEGRQRIEITLEGFEPWSQEFAFSPGEYRVILVDTATLTPSE